MATGLLEQALDRTGRIFSAQHVDSVAKRERLDRRRADRRQAFRDAWDGERARKDPNGFTTARTAYDRDVAALDAEQIALEEAGDALQKNRAREVAALRLRGLLGADPPEIEFGTWTTPEYRRLVDQARTATLELAALRDEIARLGEQYLTARSNASAAAVAVRVGEAKPAAVTAAEKAVGETAQAIDRAHGQVQTLEGALSRFESKRVELEGTLRTAWHTAREADLRVAIGRMVGHLQAASLDAFAVRRLQAVLEADVPGSAPIGAPAVLDVENPMASLRAWLEHAIALGWIDASG